MTRLEALDAVVVAARKVVHTPIFRVSSEHILALADALAALDALPAEPQGETVTLAVWGYEDGETYFCKPGSEMDDRGGRWTRLGTVTLLLDRERGE